MKKNTNTSLLDYIHPNNKSLLDEYIIYIKCSLCGEIMTDPTMCLTCKKNLCSKCKCPHKLTQSRYIKLVLETMKFQCKYSCGEKNLNIHDVKNHVLNCPKAMPDLKSSNISMTNKKDAISIGQSQIIDGFITLNQPDIKIDSYEGSYAISCPKCYMNFYKKEDYVIHCSACQAIKVIEKPLSTALIQAFSSNSSGFQKNFNIFYSDKVEFYKAQALNTLSHSQNLLNEKQDSITNLENQIQKYTKMEDVMQEDPYLNELITKEKSLNEQLKCYLDTYKKLVEEIDSQTLSQEGLMKSDYSEYEKEIIALDIEEKWIKECLENYSFSTDCGNKCAICKNEGKDKKYSCQICKQRYCIDKCIKKCKGSVCTKYICPKDASECKLCHKIVYCESCQKKCFYDSCKNRFCTECYKRNEHQARSSTINCKFFTCDNDQICDCLMTSLFCAKCEKRLCNKCLMKDKDHYSILKIF